jgi:Fe-S cluster biosynthesis and repair protein YggX
MRKIFCHKLKTELEGLKFPPIPGALGKRIFDEISAAAWQQWMEHQTILINEYRLNLTEPKSRAYLLEEMNKFFFGKDSQTSKKPAAYKPIEEQ